MTDPYAPAILSTGPLTPSTSLHQQNYNITMHIETSASEEEEEGGRARLHPYFTTPPRADEMGCSSSSTNTTSMATEYGPEAPWLVQSASGLIRHAVERLERMLWLGMETQARMLAQEIQRWSEEHYSPNVRDLLRRMHECTGDFMLPGFELGIALTLTPDEGKWLQGLLENALRIGEDEALQHAHTCVCFQCFAAFTSAYLHPCAGR